MLICWAKKAAVHVERSDASVGVLFFVGFKCSPSLFPIYFRTVKNGLVLHSPLYLHLYVSVSRSLCVRKTPQSCCLLSPSFLLSLFACDGGCFPVVGGHGDGSAGRPLDQMEEQIPQIQAPLLGQCIEIDVDLPLGETSLGSTRLCGGGACGLSDFSSSSKDAKERSASMRKLVMAVILCAIFMSIEVVGGIKSNSLAILTDAAHLLSDVAAFAISLFSIWAAGWEATPRQSYGFFRIEILGALVSIQLIWLIAGILVFEAISGILHDNGEVKGQISKKDEHEHLLKHASDAKSPQTGPKKKRKHRNINVHSAYLHVLGDSIQSIGVMISGAIIWFKPEWKIIDLICTLVFSVIVLATTIKMLRNILEVLMESTPREIDATRLEKGLCQVHGVVAVHELHIWAITVGKVLLACHVTITPDADADHVLHMVVDYIRREYNITHVTIQIEHALG
ncbi:hypothetical protein Taro_030345 [Colocasia esculenta]|uniref:Uncharacterized protein n=1 Tax=Colocasia esculenta TaxID=4460 RepID=A0A843W323_COLES|nr:hypothetical protein [Colocasia esculenta]